MGEPVTGSDYSYINNNLKEKFTLKGLKILSLNGFKFYSEASDGFKTKMYRTNDKDISEVKKKDIRNYLLDVVIFDQQGNTEEKLVDNFVRLNQNVYPIANNSFELWNSLETVKIISKIKEVAKYESFKQTGKRMKEEELVTILAYANSQNITIDNIEKLFKVRKVLENQNKPIQHYEIKISIKNKGEITDYLEAIEPNSENEKHFLESIHSIEKFIQKLKVLSDNDHYKLVKMFNPYTDSPIKGSMNDFYISWLFLNNLELHFITTYKNELFKELEMIFYLMKKMPEYKTKEDFIEYMQNKIDKYLRFSGTIV